MGTEGANEFGPRCLAVRYTGSVALVEKMQRLIWLQVRAARGDMTGVALVDRRGDVVCLAGAISEQEASRLAALAMYRSTSDEFDEDLFDGVVMEHWFGEHAVAVASAKRQLLVVAMLRKREGTDRTPSPELYARARIIRDIVADMLSEHEPSEPPRIVGGGRGGSGPASADLQLIELGITVPRVRPKA